jgi:hypothetical protein
MARKEGPCLRGTSDVVDRVCDRERWRQDATRNGKGQCRGEGIPVPRALTEKLRHSVCGLLNAETVTLALRELMSEPGLGEERTNSGALTLRLETLEVINSFVAPLNLCVVEVTEGMNSTARGLRLLVVRAMPFVDAIQEKWSATAVLLK